MEHMPVDARPNKPIWRERLILLKLIYGLYSFKSYLTGLNIYNYISENFILCKDT